MTPFPRRALAKTEPSQVGARISWCAVTREQLQHWRDAAESLRRELGLDEVTVILERRLHGHSPTVVVLIAHGGACQALAFANRFNTAPERMRDVLLEQMLPGSREVKAMGGEVDCGRT